MPCAVLRQQGRIGRRGIPEVHRNGRIAKIDTRYGIRRPEYNSVTARCPGEGLNPPGLKDFSDAVGTRVEIRQGELALGVRNRAGLPRVQNTIVIAVSVDSPVCDTRLTLVPESIAVLVLPHLATDLISNAAVPANEHMIRVRRENIQYTVPIHVRNEDRKSTCIFIINKGVDHKVLVAVIFIPSYSIIFHGSRDHIHIPVAIQISRKYISGSGSTAGNDAFRKVLLPIVFVPCHGIVVRRGCQDVPVAIAVDIGRANVLTTGGRSTNYVREKTSTAHVFIPNYLPPQRGGEHINIAVAIDICRVYSAGP